MTTAGVPSRSWKAAVAAVLAFVAAPGATVSLPGDSTSPAAAAALSAFERALSVRRAAHVSFAESVYEVDLYRTLAAHFESNVISSEKYEYLDTWGVRPVAVDAVRFIHVARPAEPSDATIVLALQGARAVSAAVLRECYLPTRGTCTANGVYFPRYGRPNGRDNEYCRRYLAQVGARLRRGDTSILADLDLGALLFPEHQPRRTRIMSETVTLTKFLDEGTLRVKLLRSSDFGMSGCSMEATS